MVTSGGHEALSFGEIAPARSPGAGVPELVRSAAYKRKAFSIGTSVKTVKSRSVFDLLLRVRPVGAHERVVSEWADAMMS